MSKFIVLGAGGVLGKTLCRDLTNDGSEVVPVFRNDFDLLNYSEVNDFFKAIGDATVVNCVAYMPADKCEENILDSQKVNVDIVENLSNTLSVFPQISLIQFSSDFIFDGKSTSPYTEDSKPNPLNVYGQHKVEAERIVQEKMGERGKIIRFASLVSHSQERKTFLEKVIDRAKTADELKLVSDLIISTATSTLISKIISNVRNIQKPIIHAVHEGQTTWFSIATAALNELRITTPRVSVDSSSFPTVARRPLYSVLKPSEEVANIDPRNWEVAVREYALNHLG